jgi:hypothetical protein
LAADEALHTDDPLDYPTFGASTDQYAPPPGLTRAQKDAEVWARDFYVVWGEFSTEKKFEWVAKWDLARADDRQMRRLMERDNKKIRDDYKKEYNEAVRVSALQDRELIRSNSLFSCNIEIRDTNNTNPASRPLGQPRKRIVLRRRHLPRPSRIARPKSKRRRQGYKPPPITRSKSGNVFTSIQSATRAKRRKRKKETEQG